ncbi:twinfilin-1-like [Takifugu rubripes]|uniref:twinfilin-1-like n=1 Tax=Takifugu rubripes TaxID=31033 RepID=UPI001145A322|nr:twinfilin-1-like [Takifugu rubripes]XP_029697363.1 twinfilin-1-like [Takifugu rubripes]
MFKGMDVPVGQELKDLFAKFFNGDKYGVIKITIQENELWAGSFKEFTESRDQDIESAVLPLLDDDASCYILYRLGFPGSGYYLWVYLCWVPVQISKGEKMMYLSSRAKLREEFGSGFIFREFNPETKEEVVSGFESILADWQRKNGRS